MWIIIVLMHFTEFLGLFVIFGFIKFAEYCKCSCFSIFFRTLSAVRHRKKSRTIISQTDNISSNINIQKFSSEFSIILDLDETLVHTTDEPPTSLQFDYFTINVYLK